MPLSFCKQHLLFAQVLRLFATFLNPFFPIKEDISYGGPLLGCAAFSSAAAVGGDGFLEAWHGSNDFTGNTCRWLILVRLLRSYMSTTK